MREEKSGKMVATEQGSYYYHADHLGSSSVVTDKQGKFYEQIEYFPYGETWVNNKATAEQTSSLYKFTGKEYDPETGWYYFGWRYFDSKLSRWISADPPLARGDYLPVPAISDEAKQRNANLPGMGGVFNTINIDAYHYAGDNPVKFVDPDGLWTFQLGFQGTGGLGGGGTVGVGIIFGRSEEKGWQFGTYKAVGAGGYSGWSGSVSIEGTWSSNTDINKVAGSTGTVGGALDIGPSIGGEVNIPADGTGANSYSGSIGLGIGPVPVESHGFVVKTWVQDHTQSAKDFFKSLLD